MWEDGRAELQLGANTLGGRGAGTVDAPLLAELPPSAVIVVRSDAPSVVRRLAPGVAIRVDGRPLEEAPVPLRHGTRLDLGFCRLTYSQPQPGRAKRAGDTTELHAAFTSASPGVERAAGDQWLLIEVRTGRAIPIAAEGAVIGRDAECDVVVAGKGVSRRHAVIAPVMGGFAVSDHSANGTQVNGARLVGPHELSPGDVLRIDAEEFRVHVGAAPPGVRTRADATIVMSAVADPTARSASAERPAIVRAAPPAAGGMATLRITGGPVGRAEFRIDRPVCAIGRGGENDVALDHDSVSESHATLLRKGGAWFVVDLGSANGTFLDGYRVAGERALSPGSVLTFGSVKCVFRPRGAESVTPRAVRRLPGDGILRRLAMLFRRRRRGGGD